MSDATAQVLTFVLSTLLSCISEPSTNRAAQISVMMLALTGISLFHFVRARLLSRRLKATASFISNLQNMYYGSLSLGYITNPTTRFHLDQRLKECQRRASLLHLQLFHISTMSWRQYIPAFRELSAAIQDTQIYAEGLRQEILRVCELHNGRL